MVLCAFCGMEFDPADAETGSLPGTVLCPTCNQQIDLPIQTPPPAPDPTPPRDDEPKPPAWEGEGSVLINLCRTIGQILLHPGKTLDTPAPQSQAAPLGFGLVVGTLGLCFEGLWGRILGDETWVGDLGLLLLVFSPMLVLAALYLSALVYHFGLWMVGGSKNGFIATFRFVSYSQAANIFLAIPLLGSIIAGIWGVVIFIIGLAGAQGIYKRQVVSALLVSLSIIALAAAVLVAPFLVATMGSRHGGFF